MVVLGGGGGEWGENIQNNYRFTFFAIIRMFASTEARREIPLPPRPQSSLDAP